MGNEKDGDGREVTGPIPHSSPPCHVLPKGYSSLQLAGSPEGMATIPSKLGSFTLWLLVQFAQGESPGAWRVRRKGVFVLSLPPHAQGWQWLPSCPSGWG